MKRTLLLLTALGVTLVTACVDQPTAPTLDTGPDGVAPRLDLVDARNGVDGNPGFYWLWPMVRPFVWWNTTADKELRPTVEICRRAESGDGCAEGEPLLASFTRDGPPNGRVRVGYFGNYSVRWIMNHHRPERGEIYRVRVLVGGFELGFADVIALKPRDAVRERIFGYQSEEDVLVPISDRGSFPIVFRILEGALDQEFCDPDNDGDVEDCSAVVEIAGDGIDTRIELTGIEAGGGSVVAAVVTAPDAVFLDAEGVPIPEVVVAAEVELLPPSDDLLLDDDRELPFFIEINTFPENVSLDPETGVTVVICQDDSELAGRGIDEAMHSQLIAYKVSDPKEGFPDGETIRLATTFGAPECTQETPAPAPGLAGMLRRGASTFFDLVGPEPLSAVRLHGGLNTVVRRPGGFGDDPFSTFGATLGPNADETTAAVPDGVVGEATTIAIQVRTALGEDFAFGGDQLDVWVSAGPNEGAEVGVVDNGDGTYGAQYTPLVAGLDEISIALTTFDGFGLGEIGGSPFESRVRPIAVPARSTVTVESGLVGEPVTVTLQARDAQGDAVGVGGNDVEVSVTGPDPGTLNVVDNDDGTYTATYTPTGFGPHFVDVRLDGVGVAGTPVRAPVSSQPIQWTIESGGTGHWYQIRYVDFAAPPTWLEARSAAMSMSHAGMPGHLVTVQAAAEHDFLQATFAPPEATWIGLADPDFDGVLTWVTGSPVHSYTAGCLAKFCNWGPGQPAVGNANAYVEMNPSSGASPGTWNAVASDGPGRIGGYLVEYEAASGAASVRVTVGLLRITGATVVLSGEGVSVSGVTDASGTVDFLTLPVGTYDISVTADGMHFPHETVDVALFELTTVVVTGSAGS